MQPTAAGIAEGAVFRAISEHGRAWGDGLTAKVVWDVVRAAAKRAGIEKLAPHDLRRTCARLCHLAGGELDQVQFLLVHVSTIHHLTGSGRVRGDPDAEQVPGLTTPYATTRGLRTALASKNSAPGR